MPTRRAQRQKSETEKVMSKKVALCADSLSVQYPEAIGLEGEDILSQQWLSVFSSAYDLRLFLRGDHSVQEVWVISGDDAEPLNIAAALSKDSDAYPVFLVSNREAKSGRLNAKKARVSRVLSLGDFAKMYYERKTSGGAADGEAQDAEAESDEAHEKSVASPNAVSTAFIMPVVSASGGSGKSTVAALSALIAQRMGFKTLLLDLDLQFGDMREIVGGENTPSLDEFLDNPETRDAILNSKRSFEVIGAAEHLEAAEELVGRLPQVLDELSEAYEVIVANTGSFWTEQHAILFEHSSRVLFLVDQRPSSLRACKRALDLCARCGIAASPLLFVVNHCSKGALYTSIDVSCALHGAHAVEIKNGGPEVEELMAAGQALDLLPLQNSLCMSLEKVLHDVLPRRSDAEEDQSEKKRKKPWMFFGRLGKAGFDDAS